MEHLESGFFAGLARGREENANRIAELTAETARLAERERKLAEALENLEGYEHDNILEWAWRYFDGRYINLNNLDTEAAKFAVCVVSNFRKDAREALDAVRKEGE